jgi:hypothetical protein
MLMGDILIDIRKERPLARPVVNRRRDEVSAERLSAGLNRKPDIRYAYLEAFANK